MNIPDPGLRKIVESVLTWGPDALYTMVTDPNPRMSKEERRRLFNYLADLLRWAAKEYDAMNTAC